MASTNPAGSGTRGPAGQQDPSSTHAAAPTNAVSGKIMIAAVVVLFVVVAFILILHVYAKWFWRSSYSPSGRRQQSWRRRRRLDFSGRHGHPDLASSVGLEKSVIDSMPTFVYKVLESEVEALECAVCLCEFQENEKGRLLPKCSHSFHIECIDMWFYSHSSCPICRTSALPDATLQANLSHQVQIILVEDNPSLPQLQNSDISPQAEAISANAIPSLVAEPGLTRASSERFHVSRYPTNVLFWGDQTHFSSRARSAPLKQAAKSMPHISIDIPQRSESFLVSRSSASGSNPSRGYIVSSPRYSSIEEEPSSSDGQAMKSPTARLKSLKRLLSRDRKVIPTDRHGDCEQGESVSNA